MKNSLIFLTLSALGLGSASAVVTATNLLAYYDFNGQSNDQSGNGANATLAGGAVISAAGAGVTGGGGDSALDLGASGGANAQRADAAPNFASATANNAMAVSFWQYDIGNGSGGNVATTAFGLLSSTGGGTRGFQAHTPWSDGTLYFDHGGACCGGGNRLTHSVGTSLLDGWHHIVLQVDGGNKQIWVDGVNVATQATGAAVIPTFTNQLMIGAEPAGTNNGFGGRIDDFAVWDTALDANDIAALNNMQTPLQILVPEPSSSLLVLLGSMVLFRRRRRR